MHGMGAVDLGAQAALLKGFAYSLLRMLRRVALLTQMGKNDVLEARARSLRDEVCGLIIGKVPPVVGDALDERVGSPRLLQQSRVIIRLEKEGIKIAVGLGELAAHMPRIGQIA